MGKAVIPNPKLGEMWKVNWKPEPSFVILLENAVDETDVYVYDIQKGYSSVEPWFPNTVHLWEKL